MAPGGSEPHQLGILAVGRLSYGVTSIMCQYSDNLRVGMNGSIDVIVQREK